MNLNLDWLENATTCTEEESREYDWRNSISPRLEACGFEDRFRRQIKDWKIPEQHRIYAKCFERLTGCGSIIALIGERGTGKTTIAAQIAVARTWAWWDYGAAPDEQRSDLREPRDIPRYVKMCDVIAALKPIYADFGTTIMDDILAARERLCRMDLLIIDEIHACDDQRMKDRVLTDVIDRRYAKLRDTVIISNQTRKDFLATTNDSVMSRIHEHGMIIECTWKPWR